MSNELEYALAAREALANDGVSPQALGALGARLLVEFAEADRDRFLTEQRWLKALRQFKGKYDPEVLALIGPKRSRAFVRKTRVKVKTVDSRVEDLLFPAGSEKNYEVTNTPIPSVPDEVRHQVAQGLTQMLRQQAAQQQPGQPQQPQQPPMPTKEMVDNAILELCKASAKKMAKVIDDQLTEIRYKQMCKQVMHSAHLYGTGILKGPLVEKRIRSTFVQENGKWVEKSEAYVVPFIDYVPLWRFYPDMGASELKNCRYVFERHQMSQTDLAELGQRKTFNTAVINEYIKSHPKGEVTIKYVDNELKIIGERVSNQSSADGNYEVLERWGWLTGQDLKNEGIDVKDDRLTESFFSNVWLLPNGAVIKAVLQPINGVTWPYHMYYFDKDETNIFAEGLPDVTSDDQTMLNAATRLMLDSGAITSGPMIEVATQLLSNFDVANEIEPWKVLHRNLQQPGVPAVRVVEIPGNLQALSGLAERFENNIDEVSAVPRYMTGENPGSGAAGTKGGLSMLMGAANIMIKDLISSWDEGVTRPFIQALYRWNMQFNPDNSIKGDFDVKARGSASLVAREVRAAQLDQFAISTANPMDAPFIKRDALLRQRAEANELTDVVKTEDEVKAEQNNELMQAQQQLAQQQAQLAMAELEKKVALLTAQAAKASAEVELILAKATESKVSAVFSALQAGGVATERPNTAPAGDEILRSSGWVDATPTPTIAQLDGPPVQNQPAAPSDPMANHNGDALPDVPTPQVAQHPQPASPEVATGREGMHRGIETSRIEA